MRQLVLHESRRLIPQSTCDRIELQRTADHPAVRLAA